jgi:hypothetical protein
MQAAPRRSAMITEYLMASIFAEIGPWQAMFCKIYLTKIFDSKKDFTFRKNSQ